MGSSRSKELCCIGGVYRRTIGRFVNANGKLAPKKFLLGRDQQAAELASLRLEVLWRQIVTEAKRQSEANRNFNRQLDGSGVTYLELPAEFQPQSALMRGNESIEPLWTEETLQLAEIIRRGESNQIRVFPAHESHAVPAYAERVRRLQAAFPSFIVRPGDADAFARSRERELQLADFFGAQEKEARCNADQSTQVVAGPTLYAAIDAFVAHVRSTRRKEGDVSEWGYNLIDQAKRQKLASSDMPLSEFRYSKVEAIKDFWSGRPLTRYGKPASVEHVRAQINCLKLFCKWLHRSSDFDWRLPEDFADAVKFDRRSIMTDAERATKATGVATYTVAELEVLWQASTEHERLVMLLGLNCGFAQAEITSLRTDEIQGNRIARIRRKSGVYGEWLLWPQTQAAIASILLDRKKEDGSPYLCTNAQGQRIREQTIANAWNRLLKRVKTRHPKFRSLSFKFLRKTAAQMIRTSSDGETAAIFLAHGSPVAADELVSAYSRPNFEKVDSALRVVHGMLKTVFFEG